MNIKMQNKWLVIAGTIGIGIASALLVFWLAGCGSLKRTTIVAISAGSGAVLGSPLGPPGMVGGATVAGGIASAVVEADASEDRAERATDKLGGMPVPKPGVFDWFEWWYALVGAWVWLRRAHLMDALTGKEPRGDAILRALGLRTHRTPIPAKRVAADRGPT